MYISDKDCRRTAITYGWIGLGCLLFSTVYECFSHGVYAASMLCLCLYPWGGGALLFWLMERLSSWATAARRRSAKVLPGSSVRMCSRSK